MEQSMNTATAPARKKGKESSVLLLIIGVIGIAGLVYILNSSSNKSGFSEDLQPKQEQVVVIN